MVHRSDRYVGNTDTKVVHDLDNKSSQCQIDELLAGGNYKYFSSLEQALNAGYRKCSYCF